MNKLGGWGLLASQVRRLGAHTTLALVLVGAPAAAQDLDAMLTNPNVHDVIDALPSAERRNIIGQLAERLEGDTRRVGTVLCAVLPWTTGDETQDGNLQRLAWRLMLEDENAAETIEFRWLDCVAANREGAYRAQVLDPMFELRQSFCSPRDGARNGTIDYPAMMERIRAFNDTVQSGLASAAGDESAIRHSFYPIRNAIRLANLTAGQAVDMWEEDEVEARRLLRDAARELDLVLTDMDIANTRNGWRMVNDLDFHAALYAWLAEDNAATRARLEALSEPTPVLQDAALAEAIPPSLRSKIPEDHVDFVYIDRWLPGAQAGDVETECGQWRQRSYNPAALASKVLECAGLSLEEFDACMSDFEASDWTIGYSTRQGLDETDIEQVMMLIESFVRSAYGRVPEEARSEELLERMMPVAISVGGGRTSFESSVTFTSSERQLLEPAFQKTDYRDIRPQFRRPPSF